MSKRGDDAKKNFKRLVKSNSSMIWFFKPVNTGMEEPEDRLEYKYPTRRVTNISIQETSEEFYADPPLDSIIDWETTALKSYDGEELGAYIFDEWAKTPISQVNVEKQIDIIVPCLTQQGGRKVVGKAIFPSTVEDDKEGAAMTHDQVRMVRRIFELSNPLNLDENKRTVTGFLFAHLDSWYLFILGLK